MINEFFYFILSSLHVEFRQEVLWPIVVAGIIGIGYILKKLWHIGVNKFRSIIEIYKFNKSKPKRQFDNLMGKLGISLMYSRDRNLPNNPSFNNSIEGLLLLLETVKLSREEKIGYRVILKNYHQRFRSDVETVKLLDQLIDQLTPND